MEAQAGRGEHDERTGSLYRSQHPVVHRSGIWLGIAAFAAAGVVAVLAWIDRDRSPRLTASGDPPTS